MMRSCYINVGSRRLFGLLGLRQSAKSMSACMRLTYIILYGASQHAGNILRGAKSKLPGRVNQKKLRCTMSTSTRESSAGPTFTIPTLDISSYLQDRTSVVSQQLISQLRDACMTSGFFQITGHGVPSELQATVFEAARKVFSLPIEEKTKLCGGNARGYELIGSQVLQKGAKPDLKEVSVVS